MKNTMEIVKISRDKGYEIVKPFIGYVDVYEELRDDIKQNIEKIIFDKYPLNMCLFEFLTEVDVFIDDDGAAEIIGQKEVDVFVEYIEKIYPTYEKIDEILNSKDDIETKDEKIKKIKKDGVNNMERLIIKMEKTIEDFGILTNWDCLYYNIFIDIENINEDSAKIKVDNISQLLRLNEEILNQIEIEKKYQAEMGIEESDDDRFEYVMQYIELKKAFLEIREENKKIMLSSDCEKELEKTLNDMVKEHDDLEAEDWNNIYDDIYDTIAEKFKNISIKNEKKKVEKEMTIKQYDLDDIREILENMDVLEKGVNILDIGYINNEIEFMFDHANVLIEDGKIEIARVLKKEIKILNDYKKMLATKNIRKHTEGYYNCGCNDGLVMVEEINEKTYVQYDLDLPQEWWSRHDLEVCPECGSLNAIPLEETEKTELEEIEEFENIEDFEMEDFEKTELEEIEEFEQHMKQQEQESYDSEYVKEMNLTIEFNGKKLELNNIGADIYQALANLVDVAKEDHIEWTRIDV